MRWRRALWLLPLLAGLFFAAVVGDGNPAISKSSKGGGLMAALRDPLSLFSERSPGGRGPGALLSTKPGRTPHERVLSMVREHELPKITFPGMGDPLIAVAPESLAAASSTPSGNGGESEDPLIDPPSFGPLLPLSQPGYPTVFPGPALVPAPPGDPVIAAVPEPATWAMLILGFFAVGAAVRRRLRGQTTPTGTG